MQILKVGLLLLTLNLVCSCTVISAVDAVASTAISVVAVGVKGTAAVVSAVIPDGDDDEDEDED